MLSLQARVLEVYFRLQHAFAPRTKETDLQKERVELDKLGAMFKLPKGVAVEKASADGVPAEWLIPAGIREGRVVLYLHGGSYTCGSCNSHRSLVANIAVASKARALLLDYRLAPEHPHPAAVEDAVAAYKWLIKDGIEPKHIAIAGDSAGGGLAVALLISLRDKNVPPPAACVCLSPWTDLAFTGETWKSKAKADLIIFDYKEHAFAKMYMGELDAKTPLISPLYADLKGLPPLLVQVGLDEVLLADSTRLAERAKQAGVDVVLDEWPRMQHVWQFAASFMPESRRAVKQIGEFIDKHCGRT